MTGGGCFLSSTSDRLKVQIPKIIHQTWATTELPQDLQFFQRTWLEMHPEWDYCFWTDSDNASFVKEKYESFWPIFSEYPREIMRADAVRYLILKEFGGVYVDLDFECLRPMDSLISAGQLFLCAEPEAHCSIEPAKSRGISRIISNAWMASVKRHPFWDHVIWHLIECRKESETLEATGPFMLSDVVEGYADDGNFTVLPSQQAFPLDKIQKRQNAWTSASFRRQAKKHAFAVHHWHGSWWEAEQL